MAIDPGASESRTGMGKFTGTQAEDCEKPISLGASKLRTAEVFLLYRGKYWTVKRGEGQRVVYGIRKCRRVQEIF
jgi:hypothetical protein